MASKADDIFALKERYIQEAIKGLQGEARVLQSKLFEMLLEEYLPLFELKDGALVNTESNYTLLQKLDTVFDKFANTLHHDVLSGVAQKMSRSVVMSGEYYEALGFEKKVVRGIARNNINLAAKLGLTPKGRLKKGGYLDQLAQAPDVRQKLKQYVITNLNGETSYNEYLRGFRNMVKGTRGKVPTGFNGALESYYDQYVYDSFNNVDASANKQYAEGLDLKHFIYGGSLIATSRDFCKKRAGKSYKVSETKSWKNDPTLPVSKGYPRDTYKPLVERGRFRCRHFIKYITEELYNQLKSQE